MNTHYGATLDPEGRVKLLCSGSEEFCNEHAKKGFVVHCSTFRAVAIDGLIELIPFIPADSFKLWPGRESHPWIGYYNPYIYRGMA